MKAKDTIVEIICLDCCDGFNGRCQRYPQSSRSCGKFPELEKAFNAGIKEVVEWVIQHLVHVGIHETLELRTSEEWQAKLEEWGI